MTKDERQAARLTEMAVKAEAKGRIVEAQRLYHEAARLLVRARRQK